MKTLNPTPRFLSILRWIARVWGLLTFLAVVMTVIGPDGGAGAQHVPLIEGMLLALYPLAALGLLLAWRWELFGGLLAVLCMLVEVIGFYLVKGGYPDLFGYLVPLVLFALPGILFVICGSLAPRRTPPVSA